MAIASGANLAPRIGRLNFARVEPDMNRIDFLPGAMVNEFSAGLTMGVLR